MSVSKVTADSVVLNWEQTSKFQSVLIRYRARDGRTTIMCEEQYNRATAERVTVTGLSRRTEYEFYVAFVNSAGCSRASGPQYATTGTTVSVPRVFLGLDSWGCRAESGGLGS